MSGRRPRWRAYLLLARASNLPTVWTNVLAGMTVAQVPFGWLDAVLLCAAVSLMYTAGMILNDACDRDVDAALRPGRPIPAGDVSQREAVTAGVALLGAGIVLLAAGRPSAVVLVWAGLLAAAIVYYDFHHKQNTYGPVVMGLCRGLVYCLAAAAVSGMVAASVFLAATVLTSYVVAMTWVAKQAGPRAGMVVPLLIAGISLLDAGVIALYGAAPLAWLAACGFVLTLIFQRVVPGS